MGFLELLGRVFGAYVSKLPIPVEFADYPCYYIVMKIVTNNVTWKLELE